MSLPSWDERGLGLLPVDRCYSRCYPRSPAACYPRCWMTQIAELNKENGAPERIRTSDPQICSLRQITDKEGLFCKLTCITGTPVSVGQTCEDYG
jgi:hypothetical protein